MFAARFDPNQVEQEDKRRKLDGIVGKVWKIKKVASDNDECQDDPETLNGTATEEGDDGKHISEGGEAEESNEDDPVSEEWQEEEEEEEEVSTSDFAAAALAEDSETKHASVLTRYKESINRTGRGESEPTQEDTTEPTVINALQPIPQPAKVVQNDAKDLRAAGEHRSVAWLQTERVTYDSTMIKKFTEYADDLNPRLLENILKNFSHETFPIQTAMLDIFLPLINFTLASTKLNFTRRICDILVNASTGSGKTLAYSIPIVQTLCRRTVNKLRAIIIVPTKLLIQQVHATFMQLCQGTKLIVAISKLENSVRQEHTKYKQEEPDILIVTPGRLVDHLNLGSITLKNLKFLVLDEADRLLNQSFQNWCSELTNRLQVDKQDKLPGNVIKMIFSATLTANTAKLHELHLYKPKLFATSSIKLYNLPEKLREVNIWLPTAKSLYKPAYLIKLLDFVSTTRTTSSLHKVLVFVKSNESAIRLTKLLEMLLSSNETHRCPIQLHTVNSNNTKTSNKKVVLDFTKARDPKVIHVLVTTDVMSRGIDINDISEVVNYDVPISSQQYVHRCGRTARANQAGTCYNLLVGSGEQKFWRTHIDRDISRSINSDNQEVWSKTPQIENINQRKSSTADSMNQNPSRFEILQLTSDEEQFYQETLRDFKEVLKGKA